VRKMMPSIIGLHHDFVGVADANQGGRSVTNDAERVVGSQPPAGGSPVRK